MEGEAHMLRLVSPFCLDNLITPYLTVYVSCPGVRTRPGAVVGASAKTDFTAEGQARSWVTVT